MKNMEIKVKNLDTLQIEGKNKHTATYRNYHILATVKIRNLMIKKHY